MNAAYGSVLQHIEQQLPALSKAERRVAEQILAAPEQAIGLRIVDLAAAAAVSEPTVIRFCRALGHRGYQDFKLALAQSTASRPNTEAFQLSDRDTANDYISKVFDSITATLRQVRAALDPDAIETAVDALANARRVEFYGFGASAPVAGDAQHKFFRLRIPSAAYSDPHIQAMSAMSLNPGDVVVAISQSGRSRALLDALDYVRDTGAVIIALAPSSTPVLRRAGIAIPIDVAKDPQDSYTPLPSRIAHLAIIDILAVGVSRIKGPEVDRQLGELNRGLQKLRVDPNFDEN